MNPPTDSESGTESSFAVQPAAAPAQAGEHLNLSDDDAWSNPDGGDDDVNMAGGPEKPDVDQLCPDAAFGGGTVKPRPKASGFAATGRGGDSSDSDSEPTPMPAAARPMPGAASKEDSLPAAAGAMAPPADDDDTATESSSSGGDVDTLEIEHPPPKPAAATVQQPRGPHVDPMAGTSLLGAPQAQQRGRLTATPTGPLSNSVVTRMSPNIRDNSPSAHQDSGVPGEDGRDTGSSPPLAGGGAGAAGAGGAPSHNAGDAIDVDFDDLVVDDLPGGDVHDDNGRNAQDAIDLSGAPVYGSRPDREITQLQRPEPLASPPRPAAVRTPSGPASPASKQGGPAEGVAPGGSALDASMPEVSASSSVSLSAHTSAMDSRREAPAPAPTPAGKQQPSKAYLAAKQQTLQQQQQGAAPAGAAAPIPAAPVAAPAAVDDEWDQANDQFVAQQAAAEEEKKKPPLMPIDWDGAVREIRVNQRHTWTKHVTPDLKRVSAKVKTTGFMAACWSCWHNDIVEGSEVYDERDFVLALQKVEFDHSNEIHRRVLITVWRLLTRPKGRDGSDPPTTGPAWEELGFQGSNPATDLRATGLFGLLQMLFLVDYCPRFASALFDLSRSRVYQFPLAIVCFNFTATVLNCLLERLLHDQVMARFKDACGDEQNQARWQREGGTNFVQMVLNELHIGLLHKFYVMWQEEPTRRVMEFDQVRRPVVKYAHERTSTALQGYATAKSDFSREKLRDDREKRLKKQLEPVLDKGPSRFTDF